MGWLFNFRTVQLLVIIASSRLDRSGDTAEPAK